MDLKDRVLNRLRQLSSHYPPRRWHYSADCFMRRFKASQEEIENAFRELVIAGHVNVQTSSFNPRMLSVQLEVTDD